MGPSRKCWFRCNGPSTKAPQIPLRHQKTFHLALFLSNLAILKSAALFQGLNYPQRAEKSQLVLSAACTKVPNEFNPFGTIRKKFLFVQKNKEGAICAILREKTPFWGIPKRLKKVLLTAQGCARLRTGPIIMQIPRGYQKKKFIVYKVCNFVNKVEKNPFWGLPRG